MTSCFHRTSTYLTNIIFLLVWLINLLFYSCDLITTGVFVLQDVADNEPEPEAEEEEEEEEEEETAPEQQPEQKYAFSSISSVNDYQKCVIILSIFLFA